MTSRMMVLVPVIVRVVVVVGVASVICPGSVCGCPLSSIEPTVVRVAPKQEQALL